MRSMPRIRLVWHAWIQALLYPLKHRGEDSQAHLAIIRSREALVGSPTQLVNHVRGAVKSFGARLPKCPARSFHKKAAAHIPQAL